MQFLAKSLILIAASAFTSAYALTFPYSSNTEVVGEVITFHAKYEDTFAHYARTYDIGHYAMQRANPGIDEWIPGKGTKITIPSAFILPTEARQGIVINLAELRLYYFDPKSGQVSTYPIGIGTEGWSTPLTTAKVTEKTANPTWVVPASILAEHAAKGEKLDPVVLPGPDNPLGLYRLRLSLPGYLIHGTNSPIGVGRRVTHGCIRLFPADIEQLFNQVAVGTPVVIIHDPIKLGWRNNELYLEVHPLLSEHPMTENERKILIVDKLHDFLHGKNVQVNWSLVNNMMKQQTGVAQVIGTR